MSEKHHDLQGEAWWKYFRTTPKNSLQQLPALCLLGSYLRNGKDITSLDGVLYRWIFENSIMIETEKCNRMTSDRLDNASSIIGSKLTECIISDLPEAFRLITSTEECELCNSIFPKIQLEIRVSETKWRQILYLRYQSGMTRITLHAAVVFEKGSVITFFHGKETRNGLAARESEEPQDSEYASIRKRKVRTLNENEFVSEEEKQTVKNSVLNELKLGSPYVRTYDPASKLKGSLDHSDKKKINAVYTSDGALIAQRKIDVHSEIAISNNSTNGLDIGDLRLTERKHYSVYNESNKIPRNITEAHDDISRIMTDIEYYRMKSTDYFTTQFIPLRLVIPAFVLTVDWME